MRTLTRWALLVGSLALLSHRLDAQTPRAAAVDSLRRQVAGLSQRLDSIETGHCPAGAAVLVPRARTGDATIDSLAAAVNDLAGRVEAERRQRCPAGAATPADTGGDDLAAIRAAADSAAGKSPTAAQDTTKPPPTKFIGKQRNASVLNPEISATGDIRLKLQDVGQTLEGEAREFEVGIQSALDPYAYAKIFLTFGQDGVGVEEGYLYWTGLPGRIRADVGLFRQQVGDLNRWHLHALPESEYPTVYREYLNDDGLSGVGLSLYTALPLSIAHGTHEVWFQTTTAESSPLYAGEHRLTFLGRLQNFWQLSRSTYGQIGFTGLGGQNSDSSLSSRVLGLDMRVTWRPPSEGTRKDLTFRAEGYQFHADEAGIQSTRYGAFTDLTYKASQRWIFGARYDYVQSPRGPRVDQWQITPTLTWWESEFVYLRLEGQHNHQDGRADENRLLLQAVFAMGPHKHETY